MARPSHRIPSNRIIPQSQPLLLVFPGFQPTFSPFPAVVFFDAFKSFQGWTVVGFGFRVISDSKHDYDTDDILSCWIIPLNYWDYRIQFIWYYTLHLNPPKVIGKNSRLKSSHGAVTQIPKSHHLIESQRSPPMDLCVGTLDVVQSCRMSSTLGRLWRCFFLLKRKLSERRSW